MAVSICTREAYQSMKERNVDDGHIININRWGGSAEPPVLFWALPVPKGCSVDGAHKQGLSFERSESVEHR